MPDANPTEALFIHSFMRHQATNIRFSNGEYYIIYNIKQGENPLHMKEGKPCYWWGRSSILLKFLMSSSRSASLSLRAFSASLLLSFSCFLTMSKNSDTLISLWLRIRLHFLGGVHLVCSNFRGGHLFASEGRGIYGPPPSGCFWHPP